jgi:hypothetical protein
MHVYYDDDDGKKSKVSSLLIKKLVEIGLIVLPSTV